MITTIKLPLAIDISNMSENRVKHDGVRIRLYLRRNACYRVDLRANVR